MIDSVAFIACNLWVSIITVTCYIEDVQKTITISNYEDINFFKVFTSWCKFAMSFCVFESLELAIKNFYIKISHIIKYDMNWY